MTPQELKKSILQLAIQGKLVPQIASEGTGEELYKEIQREKQTLIKAGKIRKEKPLHEITDDIPFDIPESWIWCRLGDIGYFTRGNGIKKGDVVESGYPCIRYGQMYTTYKTSFKKTVSFVQRDTFDKSVKVKYGDIVMALTGENNFDIALAATYLGDDTVAMGGDMTKYTHFALPLFLVYTINSPFCIKQKSEYAKGNIIVHISNDKLATIMVPLPPLAEQKRIVSKIEELLPLVDKYEEAYNKLEKLNKSFPLDLQKSILQMAIQGKLVPQDPSEGTGEELYKDIQAKKQELIKTGKTKKEKPLPEIGDDDIPFDIPESWKWTLLSDISKIKTGKKDQNYATENGLYNFYTCSMQVFKAANYSFEGESLILPGNGANVGKVIYYNGKFEAYQRTYVVQFEGSLYVKYLYYVFLANWDSYNKDKMFGSAIPYIKLGNLENFYIPLPPFEEQKRIVAKLEEILPLCEKLI